MAITLVTAYYDLNQFEDRPAERTPANYLDWGEFVLQLDVNIVFFVSSKLHSHILEKRQEYGLLDKTQVISREYGDLPWSAVNPDVQEIIDTRVFDYRGSYQNGAPYHTFTWSKVYLVEEVIQLNPFNTDFFGWIDFGIHRVVRYDMPRQPLDATFFLPPSEKVHIMELEWTSDKELEDIDQLGSRTQFKVPGGFWTGHRSCLQEFVFLFKLYLQELLEKGIVVLEEIVYSIVYNRHRDLFSPSYGIYYHLLINYKKTNVICDWIFHNIDHCISDECWEHTHEICSNLYRDAYDVMTPEQRFDLMDKWSYSSYYFDKHKSERYVSLWLDHLDTEPAQHEFVLAHRERIMKNVSYYDRGDEFQQKLSAIVNSQQDRRLSIKSELEDRYGVILRTREIVSSLDPAYLSQKVFSSKPVDENTISIVMTTCERPAQTLFTLQSIAGSRYQNTQVILVDDSPGGSIRENDLKDIGVHVEYIRVRNKIWTNPCVNYNIGFRYAKGNRIIIQNAEVCHVGDVIETVDARLTDDIYLSFDVLNLNDLEMNQLLYAGKSTSYRDTRFLQNYPCYWQWYQHHREANNNYHFLTAITRRSLEMLGGFDFDFCLGTCWDDDAFVYRIKNSEMDIVTVSHESEKVMGIHQWHPQTAAGFTYPVNNELLFKAKVAYHQETGEYVDITGDGDATQMKRRIEKLFAWFVRHQEYER